MNDYYERERKLYTYQGAVTSFGKLLTNNFTASTVAVSRKKALNNIKAQYKQKYNLAITAKIELNESCLKEQT